MASDKFEKGATLSHQFVTPAKDVLTKLSFTHIREIMTQDDPLVRFLYATIARQGYAGEVFDGVNEGYLIFHRLTLSLGSSTAFNPLEFEGLRKEAG